MGVNAQDALAMPRQEALEKLKVIAGGLRLVDRDEALAATGGDPEAILVQSYDLSTHAWFIYDRHGEVIGIMGAAPGPKSGVGVVWMMGTDGLEREWVGVARQTRRYLEDMHGAYHLLWNYIDARNELSINWLLWSGFHIIDADTTYGVEGRLFYEFARVG